MHFDKQRQGRRSRTSWSGHGRTTFIDKTHPQTVYCSPSYRFCSCPLLQLYMRHMQLYIRELYTHAFGTRDRCIIVPHATRVLPALRNLGAKFFSTLRAVTRLLRSLYGQTTPFLLPTPLRELQRNKPGFLYRLPYIVTNV